MKKSYAKGKVSFGKKLMSRLKGHKHNIPAMSGYYSSFVNMPGKPVWSGREYHRFSDEGYIRNVIAHRAVAMVAGGAAGVPWKLYRVNNSVKTEIKEHKLLNLLNRPNPAMGGAEFFETVYSHKLISGNAYIQAAKNTQGIPVELYALRPDRVSVIAGKGSIPQGYQYKVGDVVRTFKVERISGQSDILHIKQFHPLNDWYGLSAFEAAAYSIDQHNQAGAWNQSLLQNGARPSGALVVKSSENGGYENLNEEQYIRVKAQIEELYSGAANAGRPLLLEGGLQWQEMSISPKDMDFINTKNSSARDIALAFGVPPQLLGINGDATYNNMAEARLALWEQTILPMLDNMAGSLNNWLATYFAEDLRLLPDIDSISALTPRREAAWSRIQNADFLNESEKREMLGI